MHSDLKPNPAEAIMHLGIDLGGTKTEIIALDSHNQEHWRKRVPSAQGSYQGTLDTLYALFEEGAQRFVQKLTLGIGIPGAIDPESQRVKNANSTWLIGKAMQADLNARLIGHPQLAVPISTTTFTTTSSTTISGQLPQTSQQQTKRGPICIANDADCFSLSEASDGAGAGFETVFGVILGTGVGGGLVTQQQIIQGPNAISGEWGHNPMPIYTAKQAEEIWTEKNQNACYCGQHNCIETFLSGPGMAQRYAMHNNSEKLSSEQLVKAWRNGDEVAKVFFVRYIDWLARALAGVINIVDPDVIVLGGGLSNIDEFYTALPEALRPYVFSNALTTPIKKAKHGDSSGVRGAAWLARL